MCQAGPGIERWSLGSVTVGPSVQTSGCRGKAGGKWCPGCWEAVGYDWDSFPKEVMILLTCQEQHGTTQVRGDIPSRGHTLGKATAVQCPGCLGCLGRLCTEMAELRGAAAGVTVVDGTECTLGRGSGWETEQTELGS